MEGNAMKRSRRSTLLEHVRNAVEQTKAHNRSIAGEGGSPDRYFVEFAAMGKTFRPLLKRMRLSPQKRELAERLVKQSIRLNWMQYRQMQEDLFDFRMGANATFAFLDELPGFVERRGDSIGKEKMHSIIDIANECLRKLEEKKDGKKPVSNFKAFISLAIKVNDEALENCLGGKKLKTLQKALRGTARAGRRMAWQA